MQADQDQINRMLGAVDTTHAEVIQVRLEIFWLMCLFSHVATAHPRLGDDSGLIH